MANPFFKFKQFVVFHDKCAMKVGTDGVLLGAWVNVENALNILDVGSGSGLISLMLAQRADKNSSIVAVDIDKDAFEQTKINVANSPFNNIECKMTSFLEMDESIKFDLIVSNPPFFKNSLQSPDFKRTTARHSNSLEVVDIFEKSRKILSDQGRLSLIYPYDYKDILKDTAEKYGFKLTRTTNVRPTPKSDFKRILIECAKSELETSIEENELIIEIERHYYSDAFIDLVKDYYLKL